VSADSRAPSWDEMKLARDGHLAFGPRDVWRAERRCPPMWLVERDEFGDPVRMVWNGPAVEAWKAANP
jgi:hypothetical protein